MKKLLKPIGFAVLCFVLYFGATLGASLILGIILAIKHIGLAMDNPGDITPFVDAITNSLGEYTAILIILINFFSIGLIALVFLIRKDKLKQYIGIQKIGIKECIITGVFGVFLNMLFVALITIASNLLPIDQQINDYVELMDVLFESSQIALYLAVVVAAPLFEEFLFRGIILNDFKKVTPFWVANVVQAALFGIFHMNLIQGVYAFFLGLIIGYIYHKYHSIWIPILVHGTYNLTSMLINDFFGGTESSLLIPLLIILGLLGSIVFGFIMKYTYVESNYAVVDPLEPIMIRVSKG